MNTDRAQERADLAAAVRTRAFDTIKNCYEPTKRSAARAKTTDQPGARLAKLILNASEEELFRPHLAIGGRP
jgi:hypothetical protein